MAKRGRKPTGVTKVTTSFTIETKTYSNFDSHCKKNHLNKSAIVNSLIETFMNSSDKTVKKIRKIVPVEDGEGFTVPAVKVPVSNTVEPSIAARVTRVN